MKFFACLLLFPLFSFSQFTNTEIARYKSTAERVTIIRDNWGVPHIYGKTDADAVFGLLYAQCEENFNQVEENNLEMMGRLSEVYGKEHLYADLQMRMIYDSAAAKADYKKSPSWLKKLMDAAADGVNYYLYKHPEVKPLIKKFEPWFSLMRTDGSISATQTGGLTVKHMMNLYPVNDQTTSFIENNVPSFENEPTGSNGFALSPSRTESKNAILYINPHTSFYFRSEVHLVSEEGLNTYGAVTWGTFFVYQGFNEYCGWMHTSSYADVADLFMEKVEKKNEEYYYLYDDKSLPVKNRKISISYKEGNKISEANFNTYSTIHGPVMGSKDKYWLSLKEKNRSMDALVQSWLRTKAKGLTEFKKLMDLRINNSNNTVFADNKGNIAYWHGNFIPIRDTKYDYSLPVDGSTSKTNWKGVHPVSETVHVYNPASGWIQNCNSTPFTVSGNSSPKKENYPVYMAPDGQNFRGINAERLLSSAKEVTLDKMIREIGYNKYLSAFEVLLPALFNAYDSIPASEKNNSILQEVIIILKNWDMYSSDTSVAATIGIEWAYRMSAMPSSYNNPYDASNAVKQVQSMVSNTTAVEKIELLFQTLDNLEKRFGKWKIAWGQTNRYQRTTDKGFDDKKPSLPVGLGPGTWGSLPSFATRRFPNSNMRYGVSGNSFVACVEFGKKIKAKSVIVGGQSFDPASKHFTDQAQMYIDGKFKDVLFYKEDILKNSERSYHPGE